MQYKLTQNVRLLGMREEQEKTIVTVGIVSDKRDRYNTIIDPEGLMTPVESVLVDYNHNRINTGCSIIDKGVQDLEITTGRKKEKVKSRVVEIIVPDSARMWDKDNKHKKSDEVPSMRENILNGRIGWVSVDFSPREDSIEILTDKNGKKKVEIYREWDLYYLSFLDVAPGQTESYIIDIRAHNVGKDPSSNIIKKDMKRKTVRNYLGDVVKNVETGVFGLIIKTENTMSDSGETIKNTTIQLMDGSEIVVDGSQIAYSYEVADGKSVEYVYATMGDLFKLLMTTEKREETIEEVAETIDEVEAKEVEETAEVMALKEEVRKLQEENERLIRLANAPEAKQAQQEDAGTDLQEGDKNRKVTPVSDEAFARAIRYGV